MTKPAKEFLKSTMPKLDEFLAALTPKEQHDLLDTLAGEIEERLDQLMGQKSKSGKTVKLAPLHNQFWSKRLDSGKLWVS